MEKYITNSRHLGIFIFIYGFVGGVLFSSFLKINTYIILFIIVVSFGIITIEYLLNKNFSKEIIFLSLIFLSFALGSLRYNLKDAHNTEASLWNKAGQKITFEGLVADEPSRRENTTNLIIKTSEGEKVSVSTDLYNPSKYGDKVKIEGKLLKPGIIKEDDGRDFDYGAYLAKDDIYLTVSFAKVDVISSDNGNFIKEKLFEIKNSFINKIRDILPEPEASLLAGLIVAGKESLPQNILDEFRRAGIIHIVVLSGYNVTVIAEFFLKIFSFLSLRMAAMSSAIGIILFTLMTGATATVVRASIMAMVLLGGKIMKRTYSAPRALLVAGFLMLLENPKILVFDPSFKLSFLATLALMTATPIAEKYLYWVTEKFSIRSIISTSIGTQIVVLPYLLYSMGNFSVVALFSNILTLVLVPITMLVGFISVLIAYLNQTLALPLTYISHLLLSWILLVADKLGNLSWASFEVRAFPVWIAIAWYLVYAASFWSIKQKNTELQKQFK